MVDPDQLFFNGAGIFGEDLKWALIVKDAVGLVEPGVGINPRPEGIYRMCQDLGVLRHLAIGIPPKFFHELGDFIRGHVFRRLPELAGEKPYAFGRTRTWLDPLLFLILLWFRIFQRSHRRVRSSSLLCKLYRKLASQCSISGFSDSAPPPLRPRSLLNRQRNSTMRDYPSTDPKP